VNISCQSGGAVVLAVVTAVATATTRLDATPQAMLDGFHARGGWPLSRRGATNAVGDSLSDARAAWRC